MEDEASSFRQTHFLNQNNNAEFQANTRDRGKSCSTFLLKLCVIALILSVIPLFPSDPPEFISQTVFAKSWELIHLLIIGIALSYGLFCRPKTGQIPPKRQTSQPFASNILQHSSIFDYEEGNPSGVPDRNAIPTKSFDLSHYGKEPFLNLKRGDCKSFDERPLGLPVRSLRSRVVDSDSEEEQEECASDCESDLSGKNFSNVSGSEKDENLGRHVGNFSPILCKAQSMRSDYYMTGNSKVEAKQVKFQSFRSPEQEASSSSRVPGFCSWLPESPNMMGRENSWRENNFYMPFSNFTPVNDFNLVGLSPNSQNTSTKFFMPSAAVQPSVPLSTGDFASSYTTYNHENEHWSNPQYVNGSVENSRFFMPSASIPPAMSVPASDFASMSRRYNHEAENWSRSPNLQNDASGGWNPNSFMPTAAFPPSMPFSAGDFAPSAKTSEREKLSHGSSPKKKDEIRSEEDHNVRKENFPKVINPLTPQSGELFSTGNSPNPGNGDSGGEKLNPSVFSPVNEFAVLRGARLKNGPPVQKDEEKSEKNNVGGEKLNPSVFSPVNEFVVSRSARLKNEPPIQKNEEKSEKNNVGGEKLNPSVFSDVNDFAASRGEKLKHETSVQTDEEKSENNSGEKFNPSDFSSVNEFAALQGTKFKHGRSVQKEEKSVKDYLASYEEGSTSVPQFVDPLSVPIPKVIVSPKKNKQRNFPERWDDDCFVIPLSENNDIGDDLVQENPSLELSDSSSEAPSSARSSSRMSVHEQNSPHKEVEENVQWSVPKINSEIEDLVGKNESYKPSTPSPPTPQIQTRRNSLSVGSSSRTLGSQSLINYDEQGSPPTPEGRKALSKAHSRGFSCGSFFDRDLRKSLKDEAKEANRKTKGDHQFARGSKCGCLMLDVKPTFNKAALKGKSVRTIRPKEISNNQQKNDHNKQKHEGDKAGERKEENPQMVVIKIGISEKRSNSNGRKGEKLHGSGGTSILVGLNSKPNSNGTAVVPIVHELKEEENDSEIDKKADEFIAKFKEQIRLQKVTARGESSRHQKSLYHT